MQHLLGNGAVLPFGLLTHDQQSVMEGYAKSYNNCALRVGIVIDSYSINDDANRSGLTTEYDVMVIEQNKDNGITSILYRNCMSAEGLGSVADFFERTLRKQEKKEKGPSVNLKGQNGAIVLLLCMDGSSDKGIIIGAMTHPDRPTTLVDDEPHLEGEYNGVNIVVNSDGSTMLTFKGATDNDGNITDSTQGNTVIKIEKDGSYEVNHSAITQRLDKNGDYNLKTSGDINNVTDKSFSVQATQDITLTATQDLQIESNNFILQAQGSASFTSQEDMSLTSQGNITFSGSQYQVQAQSLVRIQAPSITIEGEVALGGDGGLPIVLMGAQVLTIGNLGIPAMGTVIVGFSTKVTAI